MIMNKKIILPVSLMVLVALLGVAYASMNLKTENEKKYEISLDISEGWSIVSGIYPPQSLSQNSEIKIGDIKAVWFYSPIEKKYIEIYPNLDEIGLEDYDDEYVFSSSMWIYSEKAGTLHYDSIVYSDFPTLATTQLFAGWNFITITSEMIGKSLWESKGTCNIEKAYAWDNEGDRQRWDNVGLYDRINSQEVAGLGIVIKVTDDCTLGVSSSSSDGTTPPGLPGTDNGYQDSSYKCTETDGGLDYYTAGAVYYGKYDYVDSCGHPGVVNAGTPQEYTIVEGDLLEHSCYGPDNDKRCTESACRFIKYRCPNGCSDGACI